jgi:hypothetical protein
MMGMGGTGFAIRDEQMKEMSIHFLMHLHSKMFTNAENWLPRLYYPAEGQPDHDELRREINGSIQWQIADLTERLGCRLSSARD